MGQDVTALACNVFSNLLDVVAVLSNEQFQRSVWVFGTHSTRYVGSYEEVTEMFHENLEWLADCDLLASVGLTVEQFTALRTLYHLLDEFDKSARSNDAAEIISNPAWRDVVALAKGTLRTLQDNPRGVRPIEL